jgi:hypothetical protein
MPEQIRVPGYSVEEDHYFKAPGYTYATYAFIHDIEDGPRTGPLGEPGEYKTTCTLLQPGQAAE